MTKKQKAKKAKNGFEHNFPVKYGNVILGISKASIRMSIDESDIDLAVAHDLLASAQLDLTVQCDPNSKDDVEGQETFDGHDLIVDMTSDSSGYGFHGGRFGFTLGAPISSIDTNLLGKFSGGSGTLECTKTGSAANDDDSNFDK